MMTPLPDRPWERVAADICEVDQKNYLVVAVSILPTRRHGDFQPQLHFCKVGLIGQIIGHNSAGSSFSTLQRPMTFIISQQADISPRQTEAERAVRATKHILKQKYPLLALLSYRATPIQATGFSLAQLMLSNGPSNTPFPH